MSETSKSIDEKDFDNNRFALGSDQDKRFALGSDQDKHLIRKYKTLFLTPKTTL
ncbi:hypothetical protein MHK_008082 [Candidatus Magnetomorum sp. HK-1]|nr:hypothetical protein MHK_008082 [Candidatus Magnetomorum sp. HK-1]